MTRDMRDPNFDLADPEADYRHECEPDEEEPDPPTLEEVNAAITACPRCSECQGQEHHLLIDGVNIDDAEEVRLWRAEHPQVAGADTEFILAHIACKHCPFVRAYNVDTDDNF